jgi:homoserine kinase type II
MAHYTVLNDKDVQIILSQYTTETVLSYSVLSGGSENANYLVRTETKDFVLTVCEQKSQEDAKNLACLLEYLDHHNFTTSKLQKAKDETFIVFWNDKPVMLKQFIEGDITQDFSKNLLVYLGNELAKLHHIKAPTYVPQTLSYGNINRFDDVQDYAPNSNFHTWIKDKKRYIENYISPDLPKALIHSDIFYSNIIVDPDHKRATIMDFEEACYYYRVFDIGMMIVGACRDQETVNLNKVACLLEGYQKEITLLDIEKKALKAFTVYAATTTAFWRHHNFNYVNIIPEKKDHYLEMKLLADALMNLPDSCFVE